jgi:hypothetical protein
MSSFSRAVASVFVAGMIGGAGMLMLVPAEADLQVATMRVPDPPAVPCKHQTWANADRGCLAWTVPQGEIAMPKVEPKIEPTVVAKAAPKPEPNFVSNSESAPHQVASRAPAGPVSPLPARTAPAVAAVPAPAVEAPATARPQAPAVKYLAETAVEDVTVPVIAPLAIAVVAPVAVAAPPERDAPPVVRARAERTEPPVRQAIRSVVAHSVARTAKPIVANVSGRDVVIRPTSQQDVYYYAARAKLAAAGAPIQR